MDRQRQRSLVNRGPLVDKGTLNAGLVLGLGALAGLAAYATLAPATGFRRAVAPPQRGDDAPGRTAKQQRFGGYAVTGKTVTINKPRSEVYAFWRDVSNLSRFMESVEAVTEAGDEQTWTIKGPAGSSAKVVTRMINETMDEQLAWRSTGDSQVDVEGKVLFRDAPGDRGTEVEAIIAYKPRGGEIGRLFAKLFQQDPSQQARRDLKRLKMLMETGEIAIAKNTKADARDAHHPTLVA